MNNSKNKRWILFGINGVLIVVLMGFIAALSGCGSQGTNLTDLATQQAQAVQDVQLTATAEAQDVLNLGNRIEGVQTFANLSAQHDADLRIPFGARPPAGGVHNPVWQNCGIYTEPVRPEHAIHSLEHGAVWVTYQPDLPAGDVTRLERAVRGNNFVILSPYPNQERPVVLSAWGFQLEVDSADDRRIDEFLELFVRGPQTPERNASCAGGTNATDPSAS